MAKLYFSVDADYQKVIRLREEIEKLEKQMKRFNSHTTTDAIEKLQDELKDLREEYNELTRNAAESGAEIEKSSLSMGKALAAIGGVAALKSLGSEIIRVRGEFQEMETSIETLVGKSMSNKLTPQLKELAKVSPLTMTDIVGAEKMMLGFNIEADKTIGFLKALSDVSMGSSQKFNSLTLAFSQMSATGKLMGQDLNQMINAGFNPLQQIAKTTGKSIATLKEEMSKGAVSAEMVQQAFIDATSAGGKFYKMSENASKTINGQISMMEDAWDAALNEIGQNSEGLIMSGIQATTTLIQNYETVGKVLVALVSTYGVYKAALIANIALEKVQAVQRLASIKGITSMKLATDMLSTSLTKLNAKLMANPYAILAGVIVSLGVAIHQSATKMTYAEMAVKKYNDAINKQKELEEKRKTVLEELLSVLSDESASSYAKIQAMNRIRDEYPALIQKYIDEKGHVKDLVGLWKEYNDEIEKNRKESNLNRLAEANAELEKRKANLDNASNKVNAERREAAKNAYKAAQEAQKVAQKAVDEDNFIEWQKNLKKKTDAQIDAELLELKRIESARKNNKNMRMNSVGVGGYTGIITDEELSKSIEVLNSESELRKQSKSNFDKDYQEAKAAWEEAKKKLKEIEENRKAYTTKEYEEAKKNVDSTEAAYKKLGGKTEKKLEQENENAEKRANELLSIERENEQNRINLLEEGTEKRLEQIKLDHQKELDEIEKQRAEWLKAQKKLSAEQENSLNKATENANEKRRKSELDVYNDEASAMRDFLKEYGTYQQQKLAIAEEYAEKIKKAQTEGEKLRLGKERDKAVQQVEIGAIKEQINFSSLFGGFATLFKEQLQPTIDKLREITTSDAFKSSSIEEQKMLYELINGLQKSATVWDGDIFVKVSNDMERYQKAQLAYNEVMNSNTATAAEVSAAQSELAEATVALQSSSSQAATMFEELDSAIGNLASGSLKGIGTGLMQLDTLFGKGEITKNIGESLAKGATALFGKDSSVTQTLSKGLGNAGFIGQIIAAILSILDILKEGIGTLVSSILDTILGAINRILKDSLTGEIFSQIGKSLYEGIGSILDTITFGGLSSWVNSSNAKEVAETTERLTRRNEMLTQSIDALKDEMEKARGVESVTAYDKAVEKQKELIENTGDVLAAQMGYHGAHHSNSYYIEKAFTDADWENVSNVVGKKLDEVSDLWDLSPEELQKVSTLTDVWDKIYNSGKYDKSEYIDAYLALAGTLEELETGLKETLTQISFESMYDSFIEQLMDMDASSKDFADNISEYFMKAMLSNKIGEMYSEDLENWYNKFAEYMKSEGTLSDGEMDELRKEYEGIVNNAMAERDAIASATGYKDTYSQEATSKGFESMSQETGEELNGRFTALQISSEEAKNQITLLNITANEIKAIQSGIKDISSGIQDQLANSYLELVAINENTGTSAKYLKDIKFDIAEVKENTKKL